MSDGSRRPPGRQRPHRAATATSAGGPGTPRSAAETLQHSCTRVCDNLRDTMGAEGCTALLARALARTEPAHPAALILCRHDGREIHMDGVVAAMEVHGQAEVQLAYDALMKALIEVLGRLIGEDMAVRIIDLGVTPDERKQGLS